MPFIKKYNPLYLALLFHITGVLGILFTPFKDLFVYSTPLVLLTMFILLANTQIKITKDYLLFFLIAFFVGMTTEVIGVNTGLLFGDYQYGQVLGPKIYGVPFIIGLNWFVIVFCSGALCKQGVELLQKKLNIKITNVAASIFVVIAGATIATCFDFILEPVAIKLQFWSWEHGQIPLLNYICWFIISAILLGVKMILKEIRINVFATSLLIIQALFFLILNLFL
jgi:putative membrane protein